MVNSRLYAFVPGFRKDKSMAVHVDHPYTNLSGEWVRANFHGHSKENSACASVPLLQGAQMYHDIGADVMTLTDHDVVTDVSALRAAYPEMVFLHGFEYSSRENVVFAGDQMPDLYALSLEEALSRANNLLTIICHPQPRQGVVYWTQAKIRALGVVSDGIEVYNGHYGVERMRKTGCNPYYAPFWDELLTDGLRLWGFANDDFHDPADFNNAFNMVHVEKRTPDAVIRAAKTGRCYASTGLRLTGVTEENGRIAVRTEASCTGRFIGPGGQTLQEGTGTHFDYTLTDEAYVRFEGEGETGRLFLQPFFLVKQA